MPSTPDTSGGDEFLAMPIPLSDVENSEITSQCDVPYDQEHIFASGTISWCIIA